MAASGFEGYEKRLELHFTGHDKSDMMGLRRLHFSDIKQVLDEVQCTVVSAMGNLHLDAYVLSESSLFVYPHKVVIKTCGTTQLLKSVPALLSRAATLGLDVTACRYTRGSFIFPMAQPFPHTSFSDEVFYLDAALPSHLSYRKAAVLSSTTSHAWHVYTASSISGLENLNLITVEVCMTDLNRERAAGFYKQDSDESSGDVRGRKMTVSTGIEEITPAAIICDYAFDPCGYSMNGLDGSRYSTIHVTPEDGFSYASFEFVATAGVVEKELERMLKKVVRVFGPGAMSVAVTSVDSAAAEKACRVLTMAAGMECRGGCKVDDFPTVGSVAFQTMTRRRRS